MLSTFLSVLLVMQSPAAPDDASKDVRMSQVEFRTLHTAANILVIDVRSDEVYRHGHIPDALNVPFAILEDRIDVIRQRARGRQIVTYCSCPAEHSAAEAAVTLSRHGFKQVSALAGGFPEWVAAGGRVEKAEVTAST